MDANLPLVLLLPQVTNPLFLKMTLAHLCGVADATGFAARKAAITQCVDVSALIKLALASFPPELESTCLAIVQTLAAAKTELSSSDLQRQNKTVFANSKLFPQALQTLRHALLIDGSVSTLFLSHSVVYDVVSAAASAKPLPPPPSSPARQPTAVVPQRTPQTSPSKGPNSLPASRPQPSMSPQHQHQQPVHQQHQQHQQTQHSPKKPQARGGHGGSAATQYGSPKTQWPTSERTDVSKPSPADPAAAAGSGAKPAPVLMFTFTKQGFTEEFIPKPMPTPTPTPPRNNGYSGSPNPRSADPHRYPHPSTPIAPPAAGSGASKHSPSKTPKTPKQHESATAGTPVTPNSAGKTPKVHSPASVKRILEEKVADAAKAVAKAAAATESAQAAYEVARVKADSKATPAPAPAAGLVVTRHEATPEDAAKVQALEMYLEATEAEEKAKKSLAKAERAAKTAAMKYAHDESGTESAAASGHAAVHDVPPKPTVPTPHFN
jgi:hypothetical protein